MKKVIALLMALSLALSISGCSGIFPNVKANTDSVEQQEQQQEQEKVIEIPKALTVYDAMYTSLDTSDKENTTTSMDLVSKFSMDLGEAGKQNTDISGNIAVSKLGDIVKMSSKMTTSVSGMSLDIIQYFDGQNYYMSLFGQTMKYSATSKDDTDQITKAMTSQAENSIIDLGTDESILLDSNVTLMDNGNYEVYMKLDPEKMNNIISSTMGEMTQAFEEIKYTVFEINMTTDKDYNPINLTMEMDFTATTSGITVTASSVSEISNIKITENTDLEIPEGIDIENAKEASSLEEMNLGI